MNTHSQSSSGARNLEKEQQLTLELLQAIEQRDDISQRHLAQQLGVALGLANSYLKRCVKKGWIKVSTAPANRYLYYLTPTGFAEKARLTADFFTTSLALFRQAGEEYTKLYADLRAQDKRKILLIGLSDLSEIAIMRGLQTDIELMGVYQPGANKQDYFNVPVFAQLPADVATVDAFVLTAMEQSGDMLAILQEWVERHKQPTNMIVVPDMLTNMQYRNPDELNK